jgi:hypothetical protein
VTDEERDAFIDGVLLRARQVLRFAYLGAEDFSGGGHRDIYGLFNLVVWGRAVTNVTHHLRTIARDEYNAWYSPHEAAMRVDPLMKFFYDLRTVMLKDGLGRPSSQTTVILGTETGAVIVGPRTHHYPDSPTEHRGKPLDSKMPVEEMAKLYLAWLRDFVNAADHFAASLKTG